MRYIIYSINDCIILISNGTWDPKDLAAPKGTPTSALKNYSVKQSWKNSVNQNALNVCEQLEHEAEYIQDSGDTRLLSGILMALMEINTTSTNGQ